LFSLALPIAVAALVVAGAAIMFAGPRMVRLADRLADVTGLGEAFVGAVLVGAATSLPDILATVLPAARGLPELAVGNALGGVLGQTAFLAIADLTYRRANLEHAAASLPNLVQATLLRDVARRDDHAVRRSSRSRLRGPPWDPRARRGLRLRVAAGQGDVGHADVEGRGDARDPRGRAGRARAGRGCSPSAPSPRPPRRAVANVIGGNTFDTLLVGVADVFYRDGSIYAAVGDEEMLAAAVALVATAVITLGCCVASGTVSATSGFESVVALVLYAVALVLVL
jgi:cation:H+ antiporter